MRTASTLLALATLLPGYLLANPSPPIRRLMHEPVSMLDWGLYQLAQDLNEGMKVRMEKLQILGDTSAALLSVRYNFERDLIEVWMMVPPDLAFKQEPKELCRQAVSGLRTDLG